MKTKIIKGDKDILLLCYEKEDVKIEPIENTRFSTLSIDLPEGFEGARFVSTLNIIDEEQCEELVGAYGESQEINKFWFHFKLGKDKILKSSKDVLFALLESNEINLVPMSKPEDIIQPPSEEYIEAYNKAELNTFKPENTLVFVKDL